MVILEIGFRAFAGMNSRIWRKNESQERLIMMNQYFYYSFPWMIALIYLAILLIVQFTLISYATGNLKKQSLVEQIRTME